MKFKKIPVAELRFRLRGSVHENYPLAAHTSYKIGGTADLAILPIDGEDFIQTVILLKQHGYPFMVLGGGSNVLISDRGIRGAVVLTSSLDRLRVQGTNIVAGAGVPSHQVAMTALAAGLGGAEFLGWLPGSIGGACYMNARAYGGEISQILSGVELVTQQGERKQISIAADQFSYKRSPFQEKGDLLLEVFLTLIPGQPHLIQQQLDYIEVERRSKHEMDYPSCGCVFKNDYSLGISAGKLIENCGLKNFRLGEAQVSPFHANFIINLGQATAREIWEVMEHVRRVVAQKTGHELQREVQLLGEW